LNQSHPPNYAATPSQAYSRPHAQPAQAYNPYPANLQEQRAVEVFVLSDAANASIPKHLRDRFPQDDQGHVLFFTKPPVVADNIIRGRDGQPLAHSEKYLAAKAERDQRIAARKRARALEKTATFKRSRVEEVV
jgi:hypothetical protein